MTWVTTANAAKLKESCANGTDTNSPSAANTGMSLSSSKLLRKSSQKRTEQRRAQAMRTGVIPKKKRPEKTAEKLDGKIEKSTKNCEFCQKPFISRWKSKRFCCTNCCKRNFYASHAEERKADKNRLDAEIIELGRKPIRW